MDYTNFKKLLHLRKLINEGDLCLSERLVENIIQNVININSLIMIDSRNLIELAEKEEEE